MTAITQRISDRLSLAHRGWRYRLRTEPREVRFLLQHVSAGQTVIDIGAHRGAYCYWLAKKVGAQGKVLAFEPLPAMAEYLRRLQPSLPQMEVIEHALSEFAGQRQLLVPEHGYLGVTSFDPENRRGCASIQVNVTTLDNYVREHGVGAIGFIKCDVEGHEIEVMRGAEKTLLRDRPSLLVECEDFRHGGGQLQRLSGYLDELGYRCFGLTETGPLPMGDLQDALRHTQNGFHNVRNFGFVHRVRS